LFYSDYRSYETNNSPHERFVVNLIIAGQPQIIEYLESEGFPRLDWDDNPFIQVNNAGMKVGKNYYDAIKSLSLNVLHVGSLSINEQLHGIPVGIMQGSDVINSQN